MPFLHRLLADTRGATAIEYGLIASSIAVALAASFLAIGNEVNSNFSKVETEYAEAQTN